ncbi:MAG: enoyl-CoA hydratase/isomerase family protein [Georgfuchsia sp.]
MTTVISRRTADILILTLDRPDSLNAISGRTIGGLNQALDEMEADDSLGFVLTGSGRAFCAGADLKENLADPEVRVREMHRLALRLAAFPKISVAAINGLAFGGGLELAMACTFRIAAPGAKMGLPEAKVLKALPGYGGTQLLPRLVGKSAALEMLLTGDSVTAQRAETMGLVNGLAEDCVEAAVDLVRRASVSGPTTINLIRNVVEDGLRCDLPTALTLEAEAAAKAGKSPEARAAIAAFAAKGGASLRA